MFVPNRDRLPSVSANTELEIHSIGGLTVGGRETRQRRNVNSGNTIPAIDVVFDLRLCQGSCRNESRDECPERGISRLVHDIVKEWKESCDSQVQSGLLGHSIRDVARQKKVNVLQSVVPGDCEWDESTLLITPLQNTSGTDIPIENGPTGTSTSSSSSPTRRIETFRLFMNTGLASSGMMLVCEFVWL